MPTKRIKPNRKRLQPKDAGFPSQTDIEKALKMARRVDPVLAEMMLAKTDAPV